MKRLILSLLFWAAAASVWGQHIPRGVQIRQMDDGTIYIDPTLPYGPPGKLQIVRYGGLHISMNHLIIPNSYATLLMSDNPEAYAAMRRANQNANWAFVSATLGTVGIAWTLADLAFDSSTDFEGDFWNKHGHVDTVNWIPGITGVVLWLAYIPLRKAHIWHLHRAVDLYNEGLDIADSFRLRRPRLAPAESGIGLALKF